MSSVFGHAWLGGLFADVAVADVLGAEADLRRMVDIEVAWLEAQTEVGTCDADIARRAIAHIKSVSVDLNDLRDGCAIDGLPVPRFVKCLKANAPSEVQAVIHTGLTSQDVMDTSLTMALQEVIDLYRGRLALLFHDLLGLGRIHGDNVLMGYTRMQAALPITARQKMGTWTRPLVEYIHQIDDMAERLRIVQFGGPVGQRDVSKPDALGATFAQMLGLNDPGHAWHTARQDLVALASLLTQITGSLGKMGQDIALMAQRGPDEIALQGGGSSSAMPYKQNPIKAELLVTLAHHSAALQMNMSTAMIHEQERSGTMWALEWMVLPDILQSCGRSMSAAIELIAQIERIGTPPAAT